MLLLLGGDCLVYLLVLFGFVLFVLFVDVGLVVVIGDCWVVLSYCFVILLVGLR